MSMSVLVVVFFFGIVWFMKAVVFFGIVWSMKAVVFFGIVLFRKAVGFFGIVLFRKAVVFFGVVWSRAKSGNCRLIWLWWTRASLRAKTTTNAARTDRSLIILLNLSILLID